MKVKRVLKLGWSSFSPKDFNFLLSLGNSRLNFLLKIPLLLSMGVFASRHKNKKKYGLRMEDDIYYWYQTDWILLGRDRFTGEVAMLLRYFQLWIKCDWLSRKFYQTSNLQMFVFQIYVSKMDFRVKTGILGLGFYLRIGPKITFLHLPVSE